MSVPLTTVPFNFGGLPAGPRGWKDSRVVFIPVPYDLTSTYMAGSRRGPLAILEASTHLELYDEELDQETYRIGFHTLDSLEAAAVGPDRMIQLVESYVRRVVGARKFPVLLGGEHSVTLGPARVLKKKFPRLSFLHLDAHADLRPSYEGTPFSHACIGRRMAELGPLVQVGIRSLTREERVFIRKGAVRTYFWHELAATPRWMEEVLAHLSPDVYVTIDLDVLDPAIMPATGTPEPGGLDWRTLTGLLRRVARQKNVVGFDVVELAPLPGLVAPDFLAAKLIYRFLGEIFAPAFRGRKRPSPGKEG